MHKAPVKLSPPTNQHPPFLQAGCPSCRPTDSVRVVKEMMTDVVYTWLCVCVCVQQLVACLDN